MVDEYKPGLSTSSSALHLRFIDGLRALAALYVVIHHQQQPLPAGPKPLFVQLLYRLFFHGHYAVDLFIVLSGFCLMLPALRNNTRLPGGSSLTFFQKRVQRILPPYYLAVGLSLLLIATLIGEKTGTRWDASIPVTSFDLLTHFAMIHDVFESTSAKINGVLWSISVEWRIYLLFPLLLLLWRRWGGFTTTALALVGSLAVWLILTALRIPDLNLTKWGLNPHYLGLFTLGMLAAHIAFADQPVCAAVRQKTPWMLLLSVLGGVILMLTRLDQLWSWVYTDVLIGIWSVCLLVALSINKINWLKKGLSWQPLVFVGGFSYSLYLIHLPLLQVIHQYLIFPLHLDANGTTIYLLLVGTPLVICCSYGFYLLAERPFIPKKKSSPVPKSVSVS